MDKQELAQYLLDEAEAVLSRREEEGETPYQKAGSVGVGVMGNFMRDMALGFIILGVVRKWARGR